MDASGNGLLLGRSEYAGERDDDEEDDSYICEVDAVEECLGAGSDGGGGYDFR